MKGFWRRWSIFPALVLASAIPVFAGTITFTCNVTIDKDFDPIGGSVCNYLNTVIAPEYNNTFTNANANVYIEATNQGLADSTTGSFNPVTYSGYYSTLQAESTDPARAFVPASEPAVFGGDNIDVTSALAEALGVGGTLGITADGSSCTNFATIGSGCYNGMIQVNDPTDLDTQTGGQGYDYRTLGGSTNGTTSNYDFFGVVEHELDEVLGTSSCIETTNTALTNPANCASAADLFRYASPGTRTFDTIGQTAYFSPDGGVTDYESNLYNNQANGRDWADFSNSCMFVQDAVGCPNNLPVDVLSDGPSGTIGPEIAILNAVGYDLATPEPGTLGMLAFGFTALCVLFLKKNQPGKNHVE